MHEAATVGAVTAGYLLIDLSQEPPALVTADEVLPAVILAALASINAKLEKIMTAQAEGQAQIQTLADGMNAVSDHVTSARQMLADWIAANQSAPLDFTPALNALASVQAAAGTLDSLTPQAPQAGGDQPLPDPVPAPPDPAPDPTTPITDPTTPDLPPDAGIDTGVATDPGTTPGNGGTVTDTGGASDGMTTDTGQPGIPPS